MTENTDEKPEKNQYTGFIETEKVFIIDQEAIDEFYNASYIGTLENEDDEESRLILNSVEVLLLFERNRIQIYHNNDISEKQYNFEEILTYFTQYDDNLWQKYIIYMDLRKRGYIVRTGYGEGIEFRVYKRGADFEKDSAKYLIYPVFEGNPIELRDLDKISRVALGSRKDLIVATVDRLSKAIYYSVNKFEIINNIELKEEDYAR
jgi:tRNA-intron endonuclease